MRLFRHALLDALCGEYLLGTLRGGARRRFARALEDDPGVAARLKYWEQLMAIDYQGIGAVSPRGQTWRRIARTLDLDAASARPSWQENGWRRFALAFTAVLLVAIAVPLLRSPTAPTFNTIASLHGPSPAPRVVVLLSADRARLRLAASAPAQAAAGHSYELWLIADANSAPRPVAVFTSLETELPVPAEIRPRIVAGATLAISLEPLGGSPQAGPTGPVVLSGSI